MFMLLPIDAKIKDVYPPLVPFPRKEVEMPAETVDQVSDGYHTFDELYEHRHLLYLSMLKTDLFSGWRALKHADGSTYDGWFIVGASVPTPGHEIHGEQITYHLPLRLWEFCNWLTTYEVAPVAWDGHSSNDVLNRMKQFLLSP
jgi:hypothetical protein